VENDSVVLLQASMEAELSRTKPASTVAVDSDGDEEYGLAEPLKCTTPVEPAATNAEATTLAPQEPEQAESDPPGTDMVRMMLQVMTLLLVFDGLRKWHAHRQEVQSKGGKRIQAPKEDEAAAKSAWTKMVKAARSGDECSFKEAIAQHPVIMQADAWGCTPLHFAAAGGSSMIAAKLLELGAEVDALDAVDETPLFIAARTGGVSICELLLKAGANIDAVNKQGMTPLVVSGHANQEPACHFLADSGATCGDITDEELPPLVVSQVVRKVLIASE